jgi:hypothetical protein
MCNLWQNLKLVEGGQYLVEVELQKGKLENYANTKLLDDRTNVNSTTMRSQP